MRIEAIRHISLVDWGDYLKESMQIEHHHD